MEVRRRRKLKLALAFWFPVYVQCSKEEIGFVFFILSCMTVRMSLGKNILLLVGFDDLRRFTVGMDEELEIYARPSCLEVLEQMFFYLFNGENRYPGYFKPDTRAIEGSFTVGDVEVVIAFDDLLDHVVNAPWWTTNKAYLLDGSYNVLITTIVMVAPLLGLLGTVIGMIETFDSLGDMSLYSQSGGIAGGISQALFTTQMGLAVSIPGLVVNGMLHKKQKDIEMELAQIKDILCTGQTGKAGV